MLTRTFPHRDFFLQPNGHVLLRDYAVGDFAQVSPIYFFTSIAFGPIVLIIYVIGNL